MQSNFKPILVDLINLTREVKQHNYESDHYKCELKEKKFSILKRFFNSVEDSIEDPEKCRKFKESVEDFFFKLKVRPNDEFSLLISITIIQFYVNNIKMTDSLHGILQDYTTAAIIKK